MSTIACRELVTLVTDYLEDRLSPEDRASVDAHIAGCPHCTRYLEQMRQTIGLTAALREEDIPADLRQALFEALGIRP